MRSGDSSRSLKHSSGFAPSNSSSNSSTFAPILSSNTPDGVTFVDAETERAVDWAHFLTSFAPVTVYGQHQKRAMQPCLPGCEAGAEAVWNQLREDDRQWAHSDIGGLREGLSHLPDIRETLTTVTWSSAPLTPKHFLGLKQFAVRGSRLCASPEVQRTRWSDPKQWRGLLQVFAAPAVSTLAKSSPSSQPAVPPAPEAGVTEQFSISDLGSPDYQAAATTVNQALHRVAQAKRQQQMLWKALTGVNLRRDGQLAIPMPAHRDLAEACKQDNRLKWLRDTPYESLFEVAPMAALQQAEAQLEEAKIKLAREEDIILGILTERVRDTLPLWNQAVQDVSELDVRLAKVRMLRQFNGSIPEFGHAFQMVDAVHPETADRLEKQSHSFTPITLRPDDGVNILFGSNMGGKTLSLSMLAACQLLAQYGLPVPAKVFHTRLFSAIRFAATTGTDVHSGLSAYGSEVVRVSDCWRTLVSSSPVLLVFDEPVRSTNPVEGAALVAGLVRAARRKTEGTRSVVWVATHFADPLSEPGTAKFRVRGLRHQGWSESADGQDRVESLKRLEEAMDYCIDRVDISQVDQEALPVADMLGAPKEWLEEAKAFLQEGSS